MESFGSQNVPSPLFSATYNPPLILKAMISAVPSPVGRNVSYGTRVVSNSPFTGVRQFLVDHGSRCNERAIPIAKSNDIAAFGQDDVVLAKGDDVGKSIPINVG
jgi:hypothetical protein